MRTLLSLFAVVAPLALSPIALAATHGAAPKPVVHTAETDDVTVAKSLTGSIFTNPAADIRESGVGGHIAVLVGPTSDGSGRQVQIEKTDPFGYHGGTNAILANVDYEVIRNDGPSYAPTFPTTSHQGVNVTMDKVAPGIYRSQPISIFPPAGNNSSIGAMHTSFAGSKDATPGKGWDSKYGQNYPVVIAQ